MNLLFVRCHLWLQYSPLVQELLKTELNRAESVQTEWGLGVRG